MSNMNKDITIRRVDISQFYEGIILQGGGNLEDLFELFYKNGGWYYNAVYCIPERKNNYDYQKKRCIEEDTGVYNIEEISMNCESLVDGYNEWYQTLYTQKVDKVAIRNNSLDKLNV